MRKRQPNLVLHHSRDSEAELLKLKSRFKKISSCYFQNFERRSRAALILTMLATAIGSFSLVWLLTEENSAGPKPTQWGAMMQIRHLAAYRNCAAARAVGLAPAYRGQPGYWARNDADNDGISCEPYPDR